MTTNGEVVPCSVKQVIKKCIRDVPCPRPPKRKQDGPLVECKKAMKIVPCETERKRISKCVKKLTDICPGNDRSPSPKGCAKCEENRIKKLECEVFHLRREIEHMKHDRKEVEKALQKAILRGACALGGYRPQVPGSVEKLLNRCDSDVSSSSSYSLTLCTKPPPEIRPCGKPSKKKQLCCESCCFD
nr:PREDICTED: uncharacterized protein LOC100880216 [Megachile rotundata]